MKKKIFALVFVLAIIVIFATTVFADETVEESTPLDVEITVTVNTDNTQKELTLLASDLFNFEVTDTVCVINGVKDVQGYSKNDIVRLQLPSGTVTVANGAIDGMAALLEIYILDDASYIFQTSSIKNCALLEKITLSDSTVFKSKTVSECPALATIDMTRGSVKFEAEAFMNNRAIKEITMASGNSYNFGANCFYNAGLRQLVFPDNSTITFSGNASFYGSQDLTYVYFGKNCISDKKINNKPFDCCYSLKTVILMDIVYVNEYVFCCNGDANSDKSHKEGKGLNDGPLVIYSHNPSLTFHGYAFMNRSVLGVEYYTLSATTTLYNCKYTTYAGLPHAYSYDVITESTCVTQGEAGYVTDCPCGQDYRTKTYKTYSTLNPDINGVKNQPIGTDVTVLPLSSEHTCGEIIKDVIYKNGMTQAGTSVYKCLYCDEGLVEESEPTFAPLFTCLGYSSPEFNANEIVIGFRVDINAVNEYEAATGADIGYGVFAVSKDNLVENDICKNVFDENGKTADGVIVAEITTSFVAFELKVTGFAENQKDIKLALGAYVSEKKDGATVYSYIQDNSKGENVGSYYFVSFNDIIQ